MIKSISYRFDTNLQMLQDWVVEDSGGGFDTASARVDFYGEMTAFRTAFAPGTQAPAAAGVQMYYSGARIEDQSDGWITATLTAKGFATAGAASTAIEFQSFEIAERLWPYTEGNTTYFLPGQRAGQNTELNPFNRVNGASQPFRIREIFQRATLNRITYQIGGTGSPPPKPSSPRPLGLPNAPGSVGLQDPNPLLATVTGWVRTAPVAPQVERLGALVLRTWQETFQWVDRIAKE